MACMKHTTHRGISCDKLLNLEAPSGAMPMQYELPNEHMLARRKVKANAEELDHMSTVPNMEEIEGSIEI